MCHTCCDCEQEIGLHAEAKVFSKTEFSMMTEEVKAELYQMKEPSPVVQQVHRKAIALSSLLSSPPLYHLRFLPC